MTVFKNHLLKESIIKRVQGFKLLSPERAVATIS